MIWEMVKDSPAWRISAWMSLFYAAGWLILTQGNEQGVAAGAPLLVYMTNLVAMAYNPEAAYRCTFFDAALPVTGRQLWISKMIVLLGGLWLPVLAASAAGFLVMRNPAMPFLEAAAGLSVIYLLGTGIRIRQFHEPVWACLILLIVGGAAMCMVDELLVKSGTLVLTGYLIAGAVVFGVNLARIPKGFECAPREAATGDRPRVRVPADAKPGWVWWPVLRSIYKWHIGFVVMAAGLSAMIGSSMILVLFLTPPATALSRTTWIYLAYLPVSQRKLFLANWMPLAALLVAAYLSGIRSPIYLPIPAAVGDPRNLITGFAVVLALFFGFGFALQSWEWRRVRGWPAALKVGLVAIFPATLAAAWILTPPHDRYGSDPLPYYALRLSQMLPGNPVLWGLALAIPLAGLYWLAERSFCEMEYPAAAQKTLAQAYLQRAA
ncbi:MAG TPA: hypothetical protein VGN17_27355 [Bryobacteraceae bacterium]|jgi:hypothetical protein